MERLRRTGLEIIVSRVVEHPESTTVSVLERFSFWCRSATRICCFYSPNDAYESCAKDGLPSEPSDRRWSSVQPVHCMYTRVSLAHLLCTSIRDPK